ncbi:MAG: glucose-6-phosphate isomerase [Dehalococcoidia bacterium]
MVSPGTLRSQRFYERLRARDAALWSDDPEVQIAIRDRLGWVDIHETIAARLPELRQFAGWVGEMEFRHAVLLGMGGSSLAPEVFQRTFGDAPGYPELIVLDTTDPLSIVRVENRIDIHSTLFIVSSKSGTTIETVSLQRYFGERMLDASGDTGTLDSFIAITDPETPLHIQALADSYHRVFLNPPDIGGRYSALSFFGLVPAVAIGIDVERLLKAASNIDGEEAVDFGERLATLALEGRDKVTFLPGEGLESFGAWAEQLIAESTGKQGGGIIPIDGEPPADTRAYGDDRVFISLKVDSQDDDMAAALEALKNEGHTVVRLQVPDAYGLGGEFLRWEIATAAAGAVLGINPFDEPNVKEAKDATAQLLEQFQINGALPALPATIEEDGLEVFADENTLDTLRGAPERTIGALVAEHFLRAPDRSYLAIMAYIPRTEEHERLITRLRISLRDATHRATTLGYGPRFLHSTGQLHKGGPPIGVFLQLVMEDEIDLDIPGYDGLTFSTLKHAQSLGDLRALVSHGRRIVRVSLGKDATANLRLLVDSVEAALRETAERRD